MKKIISFILTTLLLTFATIPAIYAEKNAMETYETNLITQYYEDGSYTVTTIRQSPTSRSATYTKVGEKIVDLYNSDDKLQWTYKLIGTFDVHEGVSVVCTDSTYSSVIYEKSWSLTAHDNSYSDNIAYGTATYKKKVLFITTNTHDIDASIGCDIYGNIG